MHFEGLQAGYFFFQFFCGGLGLRGCELFIIWEGAGVGDWGGAVGGGGIRIVGLGFVLGLGPRVWSLEPFEECQKRNNQETAKFRLHSRSPSGV